VSIWADTVERERLKRNEIISAGGWITRDTFSFPVGRRFHFTDPSGNELGIWSDK
jgi:predicted enzyme related to lactoylglutathione lyase